MSLRSAKRRRTLLGTKSSREPLQREQAQPLASPSHSSWLSITTVPPAPAPPAPAMTPGRIKCQQVWGKRAFSSKPARPTTLTLCQVAGARQSDSHPPSCSPLCHSPQGCASEAGNSSRGCLGAQHRGTEVLPAPWHRHHHVQHPWALMARRDAETTRPHRAPQIHVSPKPKLCVPSALSWVPAPHGTSHQLHSRCRSPVVGTGTGAAARCRQTH